MIKFLEDMVKQRDKDLNSDERNLLSLPIKIQFLEEEVYSLWHIKPKK